MKWYYTFLALVVFLSSCSSPGAILPQGGTLRPRTPTSTPAASITATATPEVDACLVGKWLIDADSLGAYLLANITSDPEATFIVTQVSGELFLRFDIDFKMRLDSNAYVMVLEIDSPESAFNPTSLRLAMSASGAASYAVHAGTLITYDQDYELEDGNKIAVNLSSTSLTLSPIALTPDHFFVTDWQPDADSDYLAPGDFPRATSYQCDGDMLTLGIDTSMPISFRRSGD